jgi:hypothetical protein
MTRRPDEYPLKVMLTFECSDCGRPLGCEDRQYFRDDESTEFKIHPCENCIETARKEGASDE